jgi:[ribosomal protein S5]-alanine N-acetyltransferase
MPLPPITQVLSPRLALRPVQAEDLPDLLEINGDDQVTAFLPYATWQTPVDGEAWLARMLALGSSGQAQQLVMQSLSDQKVIGTVLLFKWDEASARVELGYVLGRAFWGQGFAQEALQALCQHAFQQMGVRRMEAEVNPANLASNALLQRLGFTLEGRLRQRWVAKGAAYDTNIYGLLANDRLDFGKP